MTNKRHEVFISSTYSDLTVERQKVFQTLMEMDCIPSGMELFPASDNDQMKFIKRMIDECDYYLLIVGGRYGSVGEEGLSYTEMEFQYALDAGKYIIALLHQSPENLLARQTELSEAGRKKLGEFRKKAESGRLVKYYTGPDDLAGKVSLSLNHAIKNHPTAGWIKGDQSVDPKYLVELEKLRSENDALKSKNIAKHVPKTNNLAPLSIPYEIKGVNYDDDNSNHWKETKTFIE